MPDYPYDPEDGAMQPESRARAAWRSLLAAVILGAAWIAYGVFCIIEGAR